MNRVKDEFSGKKYCHGQVEKGHSSQRFLKSHVERNYFTGISRNASRGNYQKIEDQEDIEFIKFTFSPPDTFTEMPDLVISICTKISKMGTVVEEVSNNMISYKAPLFGAKAFVEIPSLPKGTNIQIGWIQVCTDGKNAVFYGDNTIYSLEIPEIVTGKYSMFLDSEDNSFPFYDEDSVITWGGPGPKVEATVYMNDYPCGTATLCEPKSENISTPSVTFIYRKQHFLTYLVIKNMEKNNYEIIKCISWDCEVAIELDPGKKLGERVVFVGPCLNQKPIFLSLEDTPPLEKYIFFPVFANDCTLLAKRSKYRQSKLELKPKKTTVNMDTYLDETEKYTSDLFKITKSNFLLNYKRKDE